MLAPHPPATNANGDSPATPVGTLRRAGRARHHATEFGELCDQGRVRWQDINASSESLPFMVSALDAADVIFRNGLQSAPAGCPVQ
jgi:hypothetical protein